MFAYCAELQGKWMTEEIYMNLPVGIFEKLSIKQAAKDDKLAHITNTLHGRRNPLPEKYSSFWGLWTVCLDDLCSTDS